MAIRMDNLQPTSIKYLQSVNDKDPQTDPSLLSLHTFTVLVFLRSAKLYESQRQKMRECVGVGVCVRACVC